MARLVKAEGFFLDTFAIVEYLAGNKSFAPFFDGGRLATSVLNLAELYFRVLSEHGEDRAEAAYTAFRGFRTEVTESDVATGMRLRLRARAAGTNLSYADAIGYAMAGRLGLKFLTGDRAFRTMPNVEFVK